MSLYTLTVDLLMQTGALERDSGKAARIVKRDMATIQASMSEASRRGADEVAGGFRRVAAEAVSLTAAVAGVRSAIGRADEWTAMNNRIRLVTDSQAAFNDAQADVVRIAKATYQSLDATAGVYQNLAMVQGRLGITGAQTARIVETVNKSIAMSGSSAAAASGALTQFGQALSSGRLRAEEFNSMADGASKLVQVLEDGLGVARGGLRAMVLDGGIAAEELVSALLKMSDQVDGSFAKMKATVAQSATNFSTNLTEMIGKADEATGASQALAAGIGLVGQNLQVVAVAGAGLAAGQITKVLAAKVAATNAAITADRAAAAQNLAAAQALELRTRAAMLDAQAEARRMATIGGSVAVSAKAAAATMEHRQATLLLEQAQTQATAANAGWIARAGSSTLAMLGGSAGIVAMLATAAAGWLFFRDRTNLATEALIDFNAEADVAIGKFKEFSRQEQAGAILQRQKEIDAGYKEITATIVDMALTAQRSITNSYSDRYAESIRALASEFQAGKISADEFSERIELANEEVLKGATGADRFRGRMIEQTASLSTLARENERQIGILQAFTNATADATTATGALSGSFDVLADSAGAAGKRIASAMRSLPGQLARVGKSAAEVARLDVEDWFKEAQAAGVNFANRDDPRVKQYMEQGREYIRLQTQLAAANDAVAQSKKADKAANKDLERQADAIARFNLEAERAAATMEGPLRLAEVEHTQRLAELDKRLAEGMISRASYNTLLQESEAALARTTEQLEKQQRAPQALLHTMDAELAMLGMIGPAREQYRRQLANEEDMRRAINEAMEAGRKFSQQEIDDLMARARGYADMSLAMEEAAEAAQAWADIAIYGVNDVADAFADFAASGLRDFDNLWDDLKDSAKRGLRDIVRMLLQQKFVIPIQTQILNAASGWGSQGGGMGLGNLLGLFSGNGTAAGGQNAARVADMLAGGQGVFGGSRAGGAAAGVGSIGGFGNNLGGFGGFGGAGSGGGSGWGSGIPSKSLLTGEFAGGMPYAGAALGLAGAYYGLTQRGNGGFSSLAAGASYGALGIGVGGAIAGGLGAIGTGAGLAGVGAGAVGGASAAMGAIGAASWIPVVGWALAALAVVDKVSGGKVFGTKYKTDSGQQTISLTDAGGFASATANQSRQKALFGGKKRRTIDMDPGQEARDAAADMHEALSAYSRQLGLTLGQDAAALVGGTFSQTFDKKGNITGTKSTVLGRTYDEDAETFQKRLAAEQAIAAVGKIDAQASRIAEDWRKSADLLEEGANFFVTAAVDARNGMDLWSGVGLSALTDYVERMQAADEDLAAAYSRLANTAKSYGSLMADISTQVMTADLTGYQQQALNIERTYRQQVKSANDYAKALGLSGARAEDLAKIEELRALQMGKLQAQIEADKQAMKYGLSISELSPLTDQQKLQETMRELERAVAGGDSSAAQAAAQAALGFGRNLYASGRDYNGLYAQVTGLIDSMQVGDLDLEDGTSMGELADAIEALPENFARAVFELAADGRTQAETVAAVQQSNVLLEEQNALLRQLVGTTVKGNKANELANLRQQLN